MILKASIEKLASIKQQSFIVVEVKPGRMHFYNEFKFAFYGVMSLELKN